MNVAAYSVEGAEKKLTKIQLRTMGMRLKSVFNCLQFEILMKILRNFFENRFKTHPYFVYSVQRTALGGGDTRTLYVLFVCALVGPRGQSLVLYNHINN